MVELERKSEIFLAFLRNTHISTPPVYLLHLSVSIGWRKRQDTLWLGGRMIRKKVAALALLPGKFCVYGIFLNSLPLPGKQ
jgi:hypothetical protein